MNHRIGKQPLMHTRRTFLRENSSSWSFAVQ
jgi:hypothetical protein